MSNHDCVNGYLLNLHLVYLYFIRGEREIVTFGVDVREGPLLSIESFEVSLTDYTYSELRSSKSYIQTKQGLPRELFHHLHYSEGKLSDATTKSEVTHYLPRVIMGHWSATIFDILCRLSLRTSKGYLEWNGQKGFDTYCEKVLSVKTPLEAMLLLVPYTDFREFNPKGAPPPPPEIKWSEAARAAFDHLKIISPTSHGNYTNEAINYGPKRYLDIIALAMVGKVIGEDVANNFAFECPNPQSQGINLFAGSKPIEQIINLNNLSFLAGTKDNFVEYGLPPKMNILTETDVSEKKIQKCLDEFQRGNPVSLSDIIDSVPEYLFEVGAGASTLDERLVDPSMSGPAFLIDSSTPQYMRELIKKSILLTLTESLAANANIIESIKKIADTICRTKRNQDKFQAGAEGDVFNKKFSGLTEGEKKALAQYLNKTDSQRVVTMSPSGDLDVDMDFVKKLSSEDLAQLITDLNAFLANSNPPPGASQNKGPSSNQDDSVEEFDNDPMPQTPQDNQLNQMPQENQYQEFNLRPQGNQYQEFNQFNQKIPYQDNSGNNKNPWVSSNSQSNPTQFYVPTGPTINSFAGPTLVPPVTATPKPGGPGDDFLTLVILLKKVYFSAVQMEVVAKIKAMAKNTFSDDFVITPQTATNIMRHIGKLSSEAANVIKRQDEFIVNMVNKVIKKLRGTDLTPEEKAKLIINVGIVDHSNFEQKYLANYYTSFQVDEKAKTYKKLGANVPGPILPANVGFSSK
jgi:hypothetical protein